MAGLTLPVDGDKFRSFGAIHATLKASALATPIMKVVVTAGGFWHNSKKWVQFNGGFSPLFVKPTSNACWNLLYLDYNANLQIEVGTSGTDPELPECPRNAFPIAAIYLQYNSTYISNEMIVDVRSVYCSSVFSHRDLKDRDYIGSHTINAIDGLSDVLATFISNDDINNLLNNKANISGTKSDTFIINSDLTGIPSANSYIWIERGDLANVGFRYNEETNKMEVTHDGQTWQTIGEFTGTVNIPIASSTVIGGVSIGPGLSVSATGLLSADIQSDNNFDDILKTKVESIDQIFTSAEKTKLTNIEENANNYIHPATHVATTIVEDETHRFTTDVEKTYWNAKAETSQYWTKGDLQSSDGDHAKVHASQLFGNIAYTPAIPTNWNGTAPITIGEAIDRIAAALKLQTIEL